MARASRRVACDAVAYLSPFENHPRAVATLAAGRTLLGNPPDVLRRVRDPALLAATLRAGGFPVPQVSASPGAGGRWLIKPLASGGGQRVREWRGGAVPRHAYFQEWIDGTPGSVVFAAANGRAVVLGMSRQLTGDPAFGAAGFRYCGNILSAPGADLLARATALTATVTSAFDLVGVNGVDFIARDDVPYAVEVNPRWSSSMELIERASGLSVFGAHAEACRSNRLPEFNLAGHLATRGAVGKAIVFARRDVRADDTGDWLEDADVRDVPHPGEVFNAGQPVCTVFASAPDAAQCYERLVARAERIYAELNER